MQGPFENENVIEFIYLGVMLMNQYCRHEQIKNRIHMGVSCYHFVQNLFFTLVSKHIKINPVALKDEQLMCSVMLRRVNVT